VFLKRLVEYADRIGMPPTLYREAPIRYLITLDGRGRLLNSEPIDTATGSKGPARRGEPRRVPRVQRSSGIRSLLLSDNAEYTLGVPRETSKPERVAACHAAYREQVRACAEFTGEPAVIAVATFLEGAPLDHLTLPDDFDPSANITFRVDGLNVVDLPSVQAFWAEQNAPGARKGETAPVMQCVVCGERRPALRRLKGMIRGIPGGQTTGTAMISANEKAFESYGLEASLIAPVCASCSERFTYGLNALLSDAEGRSHARIGNAALVFWTREESGFRFFDLLDRPAAEDVASLIEGVRKGRRGPEIDDTDFYAAVLSASGGRAVVRDWIDTTVGEAKRHLADWFEGQRIVDAYGGPPRPLGIYALASATVRDVERGLPPTTPRLLWAAALTGAPLPPGLLYQAVRRNRAEQDVTRPRAALIKMVLTQGCASTKEDQMSQLDRGNRSPAYLCGRLLAVIEQVQRLAVPGIKATVVDRYFGTASSAPASVFGRLLRGVQPHLSKLKRDRPGAYHALQQRLEEVQSALEGFPRVLTLEEQGLFSLGYYHQRASDRAAARQGAARRRGDADQDDGDLSFLSADAQDEEKVES